MPRQPDQWRDTTEPDSYLQQQDATTGNHGGLEQQGNSTIKNIFADPCPYTYTPPVFHNH